MSSPQVPPHDPAGYLTEQLGSLREAVERGDWTGAAVVLAELVEDGMPDEAGGALQALLTYAAGTSAARPVLQLAAGEPW